jgi:predicted DNA-binding WGR domain protein
MADKLIGSVFTRAKNAQARSFAGTARDVSRLMQVFRRTIDALTAAVENDEDPIEALDASVGWFTLLKIRHEVASIADTAHVDPLIVAADRYATLRKFAPDLLEALELRAGKGSARTIAAIELLRELNTSGKRDLPPNPPMPFRKEWQKLVVGEDGKVNRRLWEVATLAHVRNKLRSGEVWVERSVSYRRFDSYLLSEQKATPILAELRLPATADEWLAERSRQLDWRLKKFAQRLKRNDLHGVRFDDKRLQISPARTVVPDGAEALADRLDAMMPKIRITKLLDEVARETGFLKAFTNLRTGEPCPNESALLAAILADGTNLGLARMAAASEGVTRDQLIWTHYELSVATDLFGWTTIERPWGRIGTKGQRKIESYQDRRMAERMARKIRHRRKTASQRIGVAYREITSTQGLSQSPKATAAKGTVSRLDRFDGARPEPKDMLLPR